MINIDDKYYFRKEKGIIPAIVKPLLDKRKEVAREMEKARNELGLESQEYKSLWMSQYALKVIANSFYGVLLLPTFRLYNRDAGQCITYTAQKIIKEVIRWFEEKGLKVIYSDTDSCFVVMENRSIENMIQLNKEINQYFKEYFKQFGVEDENNIFKLEFEKVFKTVLFKVKKDGKGAKKKYAGRTIWQDGKIVDKISITGFESRRSDNSRIGRKVMAEVLKMILHEQTKEEIDTYVDDVRNKIKTGVYPVEEIALPISITKALDKYGNQIHAKASRLANEKHKAGIKQGDKVKYIYVKTPERVIAFKDYMWDGYEIDYDNMIRRILDLKIGPLYESMGWQYNYIIFQKAKKKKEETFEQKLKQLSLW